jgi:hypothetical protein
MACKLMTDYEAAKTLLTCYHEAGHAVVARKLGYDVTGMFANSRSGQVQFQPASVEVIGPDTFFKTDIAKCVRAYRRRMVLFVAGVEAQIIHQNSVQDNGFTSALQSRAYSNRWDSSLSLQCHLGWDGDPDSDLHKVVQDASRVVRFSHAKACQRTRKREGTTRQSLNRRIKEYLAAAACVTRERIVEELEAAEQKAIRILRRNWHVVEAIASRLFRRGELCRRQFDVILEKYGFGIGKGVSKSPAEAILNR